MNFNADASRDAPLVYGYEDGWHWARNKGGYHQNRDFFWVHWEINDKTPGCVKLHVESPKAEVDPALNAIKREMVQELLSPRFRRLVEEKGFIYKPTTRAKPEHIEKFKCTSPFHVVLTKAQFKNSHEENIKVVNDKLGEAIREVVRRYRAGLQSEFPNSPV